MIQIIALLIISWIIAWLFEKSSLAVLGLLPTKKRLALAGILFLVTAICCATAFLFRMYIAGEQYMINRDLSAASAVSAIWENARSVLTEELLCRGVLLYILIKKTGARWAILLSATGFALLHWLNNGVWGNMQQMFIVFAFTFSMGLVLAYAYSKTMSVLIPFAIHLGWNLTENFIFPGSTAGTHLLIPAAPPPVVTVSYFTFFFMLLFPKAIAIAFNYVIIRRQKIIMLSR